MFSKLSAVFSFDAHNLCYSHKGTLFNVFKAMPQRILWKSDVESFDDLPSNVKLSKWLPQQDVLGKLLK